MLCKCQNLLPTSKHHLSSCYRLCLWNLEIKCQFPIRRVGKCTLHFLSSNIQHIHRWSFGKEEQGKTSCEMSVNITMVTDICDNWQVTIKGTLGLFLNLWDFCNIWESIKHDYQTFKDWTTTFANMRRRCMFLIVFNI